MGDHRMFSTKIIESDAFLDMPATAQNLYFQICMHSDDRGFNAKPRSIMRMCRASDDDAKVLIEKKFLLSDQRWNGVVLVKHWKLHNYIAKDRFHESTYKDYLTEVFFDENGAYTFTPTDTPCIPSVYSSYTACIQDVSIPETEDKLSKDKISKDKLKEETRTRMARPTLQEVSDYVQEAGLNVNPAEFIDFYESNGWKVGKNPMKDWKAAVRTWNQREPNAPKRVKPTCAPIVIDDAEADRLRNLEKYI